MPPPSRARGSSPVPTTPVLEGRDGTNMPIYTIWRDDEGVIKGSEGAENGEGALYVSKRIVVKFFTVGWFSDREEE